MIHVVFITLTPLVLHQEGHPACKRLTVVILKCFSRVHFQSPGPWVMENGHIDACCSNK